MASSRGSIRAWVERWLSPGLSTCGRCRRPWRTAAKKRIGPRSWQQLNRDRFWGLVGVESHSTYYTQSSACFPLCENCWAALTPLERLPYYRDLNARWISEALRLGDNDYLTDTYRKWPEIESAVLSGL